MIDVSDITSPVHSPALSVTFSGFRHYSFGGYIWMSFNLLRGYRASVAKRTTARVSCFGSQAEGPIGAVCLETYKQQLQGTS